MAVWGQGDPRWIVEDRPDATNVNNWHWTEKNATAWSKSMLKSLLEGLSFSDDHGNFSISEVSSMDGEATVNMRKGKFVFFYEWNVSAAFKGGCKGCFEEIEGKINIPNLSEENSDVKDISIDVVISNDDKTIDPDALYKMRKFMNEKSPAIVREKLAEYIRKLKEEYCTDLIKPTKDGKPSQSSQVNNQENPVKKSMNNLQNQMRGVDLNKQQDPHRVIQMKETFETSSEELYSLFTCRDRVAAWAQGADEYDAKPGGKFSLFGGNVSGEFKELVQGKKIVQSWRLRSWPEGHYSTVTLIFEQSGHETILAVVQRDVPSNEYDATYGGWKNYYFDPIKIVFGFGARLFN